ncbi:hypothetical protein N7527_009753 [Penicillium freii]|nr:hypothetical protein N7527_009753 [Penicillium freii]
MSGCRDHIGRSRGWGSTSLAQNFELCGNRCLEYLPIEDFSDFCEWRTVVDRTFINQQGGFMKAKTRVGYPPTGNPK